MDDQTSDKTLKRLLGPAEPELLCDECFEQLDRYVELELQGARGRRADPGHAPTPRGLPRLQRGIRQPARARPQRSARVADPRAGVAYGLSPRALDRYRREANGASPGHLMCRVSTDWFFCVPAVRLADAHAAAGGAGATYMYEFAWLPPTYGGRLGACHTLELGFTFDTLARATSTSSPGRSRRRRSPMPCTGRGCGSSPMRRRGRRTRRTAGA